MSTPLLAAHGIVVEFGSGGRRLRAVDGVSLALSAGACVGLVGESGSGKSTLGRALLRLMPIQSGAVHFDGRDLFTLAARDMRRLRRELQIVFQDTSGSLNPRRTIGATLIEPLLAHRLAAGRTAARDRAADWLRRVGLEPAALTRYPHEFSGGQRQRIVIARALIMGPRFVVLDEPVSALDVSVQAQILNLLAELREELRLTYLFISHNLAVVRHFCDEIIVYRAGRIVEQQPVEELFRNPQAEYTRGLLRAMPAPPG